MNRVKDAQCLLAVEVWAGLAPEVGDRIRAVSLALVSPYTSEETTVLHLMCLVLEVYGYRNIHLNAKVLPLVALTPDLYRNQKQLDP